MTNTELKRAVDLIRAAEDQSQAVEMLRGIVADNKHEPIPLKVKCQCGESLSVCPRCFLKKKAAGIARIASAQAGHAIAKKAPSWLKLLNDVMFTDEKEIK